MTIFQRIQAKAQQALRGVGNAASGLYNRDLNPYVQGDQSIRGALGSLTPPGMMYAAAPQIGRDLGLGDSGQFIRGASSIMALPGFNAQMSGQAVSNVDDFNAPKTRSEQLLRDLGRFTAGTAATAPFSMGAGATGFAANTARNMLTGGAVGGLFGAGGDIISGRMPTMDSVLGGAKSGLLNSWMFPATNKLTDLAIGGASKYIPQAASLTDDALSSGLSQFKGKGLSDILKRAPQYLAKNVARETLETPAETAIFGLDEFDKPGEKRSLMQILGDRAAGDLVGNAMYGVGMGGLKIGGASMKKGNAKASAKPKTNIQSDTKLEEMLYKNEVDDLRSRGVPEEEIRAMLLSTREPNFEPKDPYEGKSLLPVDGQENKPDYTQKPFATFNTKPEAETKARSWKMDEEPVWENPNSRYPTKMNKKHPLGLLEIMDEGEYRAETRASDIKNLKEIGFNDQEIKDIISGKSNAFDTYVKENNLVYDNKTNDWITKTDINPEVKPQPVMRIKSEVRDGQTHNTFIKEEPQVKPQPEASQTKAKLIEEILSNPEQVKQEAPKAEPRVEQQKPAGETFYERSKNAANYEAIRSEVEQHTKEMEIFFADQGKTITDVNNDLEAGVKDSNTKVLSDFYENFAQNAEADGVSIPRNIENYSPQLQKKYEDQILARQEKERSFGSIFTTPFFGKKRKNKRVDPVTATTLQAFAKESYINRASTPQKQAQIKLGNEIMAEARKVDDTQAITGDKKIEVVKRIQETAEPGTQRKVYAKENPSGVVRSAQYLFRSLEQRADHAGKEFYSDFLYPFKEAQGKLGTAMEIVNKLDDEQLVKAYNKYVAYPENGVSKQDMIDQIRLSLKQKYDQTAINQYTENIQNAQFKDTNLVDLADEIFNEYVIKDVRTRTFAEKAMAKVRSNTGRAAIGLNVASAANNVFEIKRGVSAMSTKNAIKAIKGVQNGEGKVLLRQLGIVSENGTALERQFGKKNKNAWQRFWGAADPVLFKMFDESEKFKDEFLVLGFREQGRDKGLEGKELNKFILKKFTDFAVKYGQGQDIGLFKSPLMKTIFQFSQYAIKDMVIAIDKLKGASKGDVGDMKYLAKYTTMSIAQMALFKAVLGTIGIGGNTGTPIDVASDIANKEIPTAPVVQSLWLFGLTAKDAIAGNELDPYEQEQRDKKLKRALSTVTIPTSNQLLFKSAGSVQNQMRGYQEKFGGNVANPTSTDLFSRGKSLVFGSSYDPKRQQYINDVQERSKQGKEGGAGLDKNQSQVFKSLPQSQRIQYYDDQVAKNKTKQNALNLKESLKEGDNPGLIDRILNRKSEPDNYDVLFEGKSAKSSSIQDRMDVYADLKSVVGEDVTPEQRASILKSAGASEQDFTYYTMAAKDVDVKLQEEVLPKLDSMNDEEVMTYLMQGRKVIGGKQMITSTMVDYLYERDYISKEQKNALKALQFDEVKNEFYVKKSYSGSGGKRLPYSKAQKLFEIPLPKFSKLKSLDLLLSNSTGVQTNSSDDRLLSSILNAPVQKKTNSDLWF